MGNSHPGVTSTSSKSTKGKLGRQRRLSDPSQNQNVKVTILIGNFLKLKFKKSLGRKD